MGILCLQRLVLLFTFLEKPTRPRRGCRATTGIRAQERQRRRAIQNALRIQRYRPDSGCGQECLPPAAGFHARFRNRHIVDSALVFGRKWGLGKRFRFTGKEKKNGPDGIFRAAHGITQAVTPGRLTPRIPSGRHLLLLLLVKGLIGFDLDFHSAVGLSPLRGVVARDRHRLTIAHRADPV